MNNPVEHLCHAIKNSFENAEYVYRNGGCFEFYKILRSVFKDAEPFYNWDEGHVYTRIDGKFYDVRGLRAHGGHNLKPLDLAVLSRAHRWVTNNPTLAALEGLVDQHTDGPH